MKVRLLLVETEATFYMVPFHRAQSEESADELKLISFQSLVSALPAAHVIAQHGLKVNINV